MKKSEKIAEINEKLAAAIAVEKARMKQHVADYYQLVAELRQNAEAKKSAATDDDVDEEKPTVWLNGEQWTAAVVARRILNKLPKLNHPRESIYIEISPSYFGGCGLDLRYINTIDRASGVTSCELLSRQEPEEQAQKVDLWLKEVEVQMAKAKAIMDEEREEAGNE